MRGMGREHHGARCARHRGLAAEKSSRRRVRLWGGAQSLGPLRWATCGGHSPNLSLLADGDTPYL